MAQKDVLGRAGEERAANYLQVGGLCVVDRNWRCAQGEIDIVAVSPHELIVVEVKTRRGEGFGHPFEAVDAQKRRRMWRIAMAWIAAHPDQAQGRRLRLDAIAVTGADPAIARLEHLSDLDLS